MSLFAQVCHEERSMGPPNLRTAGPGEHVGKHYTASGFFGRV